MTGKLMLGSAADTREWFTLMEAMEDIAGDDVPCKNFPDAFFPDSGAQGYQDSVSAKGLCSGCPIIEQCLRFALNTDEPNGIWGGKTPAERRALKGLRAKRR